MKHIKQAMMYQKKRQQREEWRIKFICWAIIAICLTGLVLIAITKIFM